MDFLGLLSNLNDFISFVIKLRQHDHVSFLFNFIILPFIIWIIIWSFLNMLIYRLFNLEIAYFEERNKEKSKKILKNMILGRSFCPVCKKQLKWFHLIPLFSYIFLRWKCWFCWSKIPIRYFLIELFSGLWFIVLTLIYYYIHFNWYFIIFDTDSIYFYVLISLFILIFIIIYALIIYDILFLYLSNFLIYLWYLILFLISIITVFVMSSIWSWIFFILWLIIFILTSFLIFYSLNLIGKIYMWLRFWFKKISNYEFIGEWDFWAIIIIFYLIGYLYITKAFNAPWLVENYLFYILRNAIKTSWAIIILAAIISLVYYIIALIFDYKNETQKELENEDIYKWQTLPFLPWLMIWWILVLISII